MISEFTMPSLHILRGFCIVACFLLRPAVSIELTRRERLTNAFDGENKIPEIFWGLNQTHIEIQLSYPTWGWLAMGLSPNGGMDQADVLFGYINDTVNEVVIQDRFLTANMATMSVKLSLDNQQDWQAISGSKNATHTVLRAVRKLKTCDSMDRSFTDAATPVIFAFSDNLPDSLNGPIRKHTVRGQKSLNFFQPTEIPDPDISKEVSRTLEFRIDNRTILGDTDTHYFCKTTTLPQFDRKYQSIASQPIVNEKNKKEIHHMLVYACSKMPGDLSIEDFFECGPKGPESSKFVMKYCQTVIAVWAMGAKPTNYLPDDVGLPFTEEMSGLKIVLQMHYNNPELKTFTDDSGMRFLLTDKIRKYDSGSIITGVLSLDLTFTLPPRLDNFHMQGQCSDHCTSALIPEEGINIFSTFVHMHTRGKSGVARHFRGSQEILPPLGMEMNYDFNFQQTKPVLPFRKFLPGDRVVVECNFTTANEQSPIFGGEGTSEEMCLVFLNYYPKTELNLCGSKFKLQPYLNALGLKLERLMGQGGFPRMRGDVAAQLLNLQDRDTQKMLMESLKNPVTSFIQSKKWDDLDAKPLQDFYSQADYFGICTSKGNITLVPNDRPPRTNYYIDPSKQGC